MNDLTIYPDQCKLKERVYTIILEVEYEYSYDPGRWALPNGDPGYPELEQIEIVSITSKGDIAELLFNYTKTQDLIDEIELKISEHERDKRYSDS